MTINWKTSKADFDLLTHIADRAVGLATSLGENYPMQDALMDLTAVHANGCPLRLKEMLDADRYNFVHDIWGIRANLDRNTGKLKNCFTPRFAR